MHMSDLSPFSVSTSSMFGRRITSRLPRCRRFGRSVDVARRVLGLAALAVLLLISACEARDDPEARLEEQYEELTFEVNDDLLQDADAVEELGVVYRVPEGWVELDDRRREVFGSRVYPLLRGDGAEEPLRLHLDPVSGSLYVMTALDGEAEDRASAAYERHDAAGYDPEFTEFSKDGFIVRQVMFQAGTTVVFQLFFSGPAAAGEAFELGFLIPRENYESVARVIESAIGAIQEG